MSHVAKLSMGFPPSRDRISDFVEHFLHARERDFVAALFGVVRRESSDQGGVLTYVKHCHFKFEKRAH